MGFLSGITSFVKEHSDVIHGVLDVAGFIPGVGAVADLANAGLYAAEGNWLDAGLSLASAVPGIGDTIALAKKTGKALKGLKGLKGFNALDKAKGMKSLFGALKGKAKTGASKVKGWLKNRKEAFNNIKKRLKGECVNGRCFTGDTLVYTRHGYKTIKEIQKGDEVYSRNTETGETGFKEVEEVFCTTAHTIYHVWIDGKEEIKTTAYHPVYVEGQGWVTAINLREGDAIETVEGMACITKIVKERHEEPVPVYNFHVKEWASYFVGEVRVYVHNGNKHIKELEDNGVSYSEDIIQYEKLKSQYAADEIYNAKRTGSALKEDPSHRAASYLSKEQLASGRTTSFTGGDNRSYTLLQTKGQLDGADGIFEYITNDAGQVTHQRFIKGGIYTGFPNQVVPKGGY